jgi:hypothetical protein
MTDTTTESAPLLIYPRPTPSTPGAPPTDAAWSHAWLRCDECGVEVTTATHQLGEIHDCPRQGGLRLIDAPSAPGAPVEGRPGAPTDVDALDAAIAEYAMAWVVLNAVPADGDPTEAAAAWTTAGARMRSKVRALAAENARLRSALAEAQRDGERLVSISASSARARCHGCSVGGSAASAETRMRADSPAPPPARRARAMSETTTAPSLGQRWYRAAGEVEVVHVHPLRIGYRRVKRDGRLGRLAYMAASHFTQRFTPTHNDRSQTMQLGEFHTSDGLTFRRNDDGTVTVRKYTDARCETVAFEQTISEGTWESVYHETRWAAVHKRPADAR